MGVCPGWHAAKASRARDVTPLRVSAFESSGDSDTSSALLLRFTDSSEVPMLTGKNLRWKTREDARSQLPNM